MRSPPSPSLPLPLPLPLLFPPPLRLLAGPCSMQQHPVPRGQTTPQAQLLCPTLSWRQALPYSQRLLPVRWLRGSLYLPQLPPPSPHPTPPPSVSGSLPPCPCLLSGAQAAGVEGIAQRAHPCSRCNDWQGGARRTRKHPLQHPPPPPRLRPLIPRPPLLAQKPPFPRPCPCSGLHGHSQLPRKRGARMPSHPPRLRWRRMQRKLPPLIPPHPMRRTIPSNRMPSVAGGMTDSSYCPSEAQAWMETEE